MAAQATSATLHTTLGDIQLTLYPHAAPKAVENFVGHARSTYYEGVIFHRVIKKFMLQTGACGPSLPSPSCARSRRCASELADSLGLGVDGSDGRTDGTNAGDPLGDGTGGESIWGKNFADEVTTTLKFDRPYVLAMANAGKGTNTNGSQFFITTTPTPHLNMAHTCVSLSSMHLLLIPEVGRGAHR